MAWWEWVPFVSTIGHIIDDPPGRDISDYAACSPTVTDCEGLGRDAAILKCQNCIRDKMWGFVLSWIGSGPPSDLVKGAVGITLAKFSEAIGKALATKLAPKAAAAASGVGVALTVDGLIDSAVILKKALDIWRAADAAKKVHCTCAGV
jgi:hypothetical protein